MAATTRSRLERLKVGDDVLAIVAARDADEHLGTVHVGAGILNELVQRLLIPRDGSRLEGGRVVEPGFGSALSAEHACERWTDLVHAGLGRVADAAAVGEHLLTGGGIPDRKSTRLNSSHANIAYAVFCMKKKK